MYHIVACQHYMHATSLWCINQDRITHNDRGRPGCVTQVTRLRAKERERGRDHGRGYSGRVYCDCAEQSAVSVGLSVSCLCLPVFLCVSFRPLLMSNAAGFLCRLVEWFMQLIDSCWSLDKFSDIYIYIYAGRISADVFSVFTMYKTFSLRRGLLWPQHSQ